MSPQTVPIEVSAWSGENVTISKVVKALDDLRGHEQRTATRTSVANLVMVARTQEELEVGEGVIDHLGMRHPARMIVLHAPHDAGQAEDRIDAEVTIHTGEAAGHAIWSDEINLTVGGGPARHPASLLRPLLLGDLPVVVWYVRGLPDPGDPLLKAANAVILDTKTAADPADGEPAMHTALEAVAALSRKHTIIDLSWHRLRTWRQLLSAQFQGDVYRPFVHNVQRIEVTGKLGPRTLLAGWLASRLRLEREAFHLYDGRHVAIKLTAMHEGQRGEFTVERMPGERLVKSCAMIEGGPTSDEILGLPTDALPESLSSSLKRLERDKVYEMAIKLAGGWL